MAATWGDGERTAATGTVSVAELCRRLGAPAPATTEPCEDTPVREAAATGAAPLLIGDLLRREGHPVPPVAPDRPAPTSERPADPEADAPEIPVPRRRAADAC